MEDVVVSSSTQHSGSIGRALDTERGVISGLYAAGNAGGAPTKGFYGGAGGTISLGLVFGYLAGREAARRRDRA